MAIRQVSTKPLKKRHPQDFYPTHIDVCRAALKSLPMRAISTIIDPGAGTGVWGQAAREKWTNNAKIIGIELRKSQQPNPVYNEWIQQNFLLLKDLPDAELVIGNPPYKYAEQFIRMGYDLVKRRRGYMVYLLRLALLGGQQRGSGLWSTHTPTEVIVMSRRPSFQDDGKTDDEEYMLCFWDLGVPKTAPKLRFMDYKKVVSKQTKLF